HRVQHARALRPRTSARGAARTGEVPRAVPALGAVREPRGLLADAGQPADGRRLGRHLRAHGCVAGRGGQAPCQRPGAARAAGRERGDHRHRRRVHLLAGTPRRLRRRAAARAGARLRAPSRPHALAGSRSRAHRRGHRRRHRAADPRPLL
ncbi:MAG: FIG056164: rhomboid family serine protease, partial [uncultured Nocardioidaceae bacterium]